MSKFCSSYHFILHVYKMHPIAYENTNWYPHDFYKDVLLLCTTYFRIEKLHGQYSNTRPSDRKSRVTSTGSTLDLGGTAGECSQEVQVLFPRRDEGLHVLEILDPSLGPTQGFLVIINHTLCMFLYMYKNISYIEFLAI